MDQQKFGTYMKFATYIHLAAIAREGRCEVCSSHQWVSGLLLATKHLELSPTTCGIVGWGLQAPCHLGLIALAAVRTLA